MADPELEAIRASRMAELQQQMKGGGGSDDQQQKQEEAQARQEEMKNSILVQVLDQAARARLNSIAMVKPEKAKMVENMLCQMATTGQLPGKDGTPLSDMSPTTSPGSPSQSVQRYIEEVATTMFKGQKLPGKIGEAQLKSLLEQVSMQTAKKTTVKFDRRRMNLDDSDDDY